jgi:AraC-like DNA-binding protein
VSDDAAFILGRIDSRLEDGAGLVGTVQRDAERVGPSGDRHFRARRGTISQVTSRPAAGQHLRDLARLRRVRDRIDREYAQPLDVEALARGAHMSAGHLSRQFRLAYGESPYGYLMTRRIERAMALRRPQRHRGLFRGRLLVAGYLQHSLYRAGRCAAQHLPASGGGRDGGDASVRDETGDQTDQESRSAGHEPHLV